MAQDRPNFLWFCTDQQRFDTIQALGNPHIRTPNLDRLAAEGVAFTHAFCQSPICTPSRASFLTGRYPGNVRGCMNGNEEWGEGAPLVTKLLADKGYDCGLSGKFHLAGAHGREEPRPHEDGYRVFHWSHDPQDRYPSGHAYADWLGAQGYALRDLREDPASIPPDLHQTTWCTDRAIDFISEKRRKGPWLMSVNVFDPHAPFDPPQEYLDCYNPAKVPPPLFRDSDLTTQQVIPGDFQNTARPPEEFKAGEVIAAYYAMIELIDENIGRLLHALEETGQRENTVFIFTSDHGEMLGDHGLLLKGCRFYEGLVRVPLIISWPGRFPAPAETPPDDPVPDDGSHATAENDPTGDNGSPDVPENDPAVDEGTLSTAESDPEDTLSQVPETEVSEPGVGLVSNALVELIDIAPTILELAGLPLPHGMQGRSLLPILQGQAEPHQHRDFVRCEYYCALNPNAPGRDEYEGSFATMYRDERYKVVVYHGHEQGEIYDLQEDPGEFNNLWDDPGSADLRFDLVRRNFDALAFSVDTGPPQTRPH